MTKQVSSTWIASFGYKNGFLALFTSEGEALLYGDIPLLRYQLLCKYARLTKSPGKAYNKLIKNQGYQYQKVTTEFEVRQLRKMMK